MFVVFLICIVTSFIKFTFVCICLALIYSFHNLQVIATMKISGASDVGCRFYPKEDNMMENGVNRLFKVCNDV